MTQFLHPDYRSFLKEILEKRPRKGRGEMQKIAQHLRVHTTLISQIMSGLRDLTEEQAFELSHYLELTHTESEYFQLLVQIGRASTQNYKQFLKNKLIEMREQVQKVSKRFTKEEELSDHQKSIFYSSWIYSAIRLYCSTSELGHSLEDVMQYFQISRIKASEYLDFLVSCQLCESKNELFMMGKQRTYIDRGSIYFLKHHLNWRMKSIERSEVASPDEKLYTVTMSVSEKDFIKIKEEVSKLLNEILKISKTTEPEKLVCFNCDFFYIEK
jgi:uncharacterized protein (TIGR02147 family)